MWRTDGRTDGRTDRRNCDSICALSIYAVARKNWQLILVYFATQVTNILTESSCKTKYTTVLWCTRRVKLLHLTHRYITVIRLPNDQHAFHVSTTTLICTRTSHNTNCHILSNTRLLWYGNGHRNVSMDNCCLLILMSKDSDQKTVRTDATGWRTNRPKTPRC